MRPLSSLIAAVLAAAFLVGCAGSGVAGPVDPRKTVAEANRLYNEEKNPAGAERLIREAISEAQRTHDDLGLAIAYNEYGHFLQSPAVDTQANAYRRDGFLDKSVSYDQRFGKSLDYFDRAAPYFIKAKRYDGLSNNRLGRGIALVKLKKTSEACESFNESAAAMKENLRQIPRAQPFVPGGNGNWEDYIGRLKAWAGCSPS